MTVKEGHGLPNLRQRAAALGGELVVTSRPGAGTTLIFSVNVRAPKSA